MFQVRFRPKLRPVRVTETAVNMEPRLWEITTLPRSLSDEEGTPRHGSSPVCQKSRKLEVNRRNTVALAI